MTRRKTILMGDRRSNLDVAAKRLLHSHRRTSIGVTTIRHSGQH